MLRNADFALGPLHSLPAFSLFLLGVRLEFLLGRHVLVPLLLPLDTLQLLSLNKLTKSREGVVSHVTYTSWRVGQEHWFDLLSLGMFGLLH